VQQYDYIFTGAGCAGLSLLTRMIAAGLTDGKRILLIDKSPKQNNDRTWCFWEAAPGFFEPVVCKHWSNIWFHAAGFSKQFAIDPYRYKMIRGIDFYNHCFSIIEKQPGISRVNGTVTDFSFSGNMLQAVIDGQPQTFYANTVFNSVWKEDKLQQQKAIRMLQHFKGWLIETPVPFFKPGEATLMDFRVSQAKGTTFVYVLPLTATKALIEYTLFSKSLLNSNEYKAGLADYLQQWLKLKEYTVIEEEFGVIPMTNAKFPWHSNGMYHIGTAGGQTKASSGYTFQFIQKQSAAIVQQMKNNTLQPGAKPGRASPKFNFYDTVLLRVLAGNYAQGSQVFTSLFKKNSHEDIFAFLDNESSLRQDAGIIRTLPSFPFIKAALAGCFS
jgi:lycopene beta-cyclase